MMSRCVVIGAAPIENYSGLRKLLCPDDFYIYCDGGLKHMDKLHAKPDLIVGDFDSYTAELPDAEIIRLPCEKDDTDSVYAVKEALSRGFDDFLLLGMVGGRLDHTLGNISILLMLDSLDKKALLADDYSLMSIVSRKPAYISDRSKYFSLINISGQAEGITIKDAKYPLDNAYISCEYQYGISNEVIPGKTAEVTVRYGRLLLIEVFSEK